MTRTRRPNGREARRAARLARGSHVAVHPGQPGGAYKPLSEAAIKRIYATALDSGNDHMARGTDVLFCTSGEAVSVLDYATQTFRPPRLVDLYDAARLADRSTPGAWVEAGHKNIYEAAHVRVHELLANYYPDYIDTATDARIRERFPIRLSREDMQHGNDRW